MKVIEMRPALSVCLILFSLVACNGTLQIGIEQTPTPNAAATATLSALQEENARLTSLLAAQPTPTRSLNLGRLAYVQGGDIWVKSLPNGKPQRLTTDGRNRAPRWSPSGDWIAFNKDSQAVLRQQVPCSDTVIPRPDKCFDTVTILQNQFWVMQADGSEARPLNQGLSVDSVAWSPASDRIAFVTANGDLLVTNADGTNLTTLVPHNLSDKFPGQVGRIAWSPDGSTLAYEWRVNIAEPATNYEGVWKISISSQNRSELYNSGSPNKGEALLAQWSVNGKSLLYWQNEARTATFVDGAALYSINVEGTPTPHLITEAMLPYTGFVAFAPPTDNSVKEGVIAFVAGDGRRTWTNKQIVAGKALTVNGIAAISPTFAPNGLQIAYSAMPERPEVDIGDPNLETLLQRRIWIVDLSGAHSARRLADDPGSRDEFPLWSADGSYILFARIDTRGRASVWEIPAAGGAAGQVVDELTPAPAPLGLYGYIDWTALFDWWRGSS